MWMRPRVRPAPSGGTPLTEIESDEPVQPDSGPHDILHPGNRRAVVRVGVFVPLPAVPRGVLRLMGGSLGPAVPGGHFHLRTAADGRYALAGALRDLRIRVRHRARRGRA